VKINVTLLIVIIFIKIFFITACNSANNAEDQLISYGQRMDSIGSARIDSAYKVIQKQCDSIKQSRVPLLVDSILKKDSAFHE
jgi:hypothetical protein